MTGRAALAGLVVALVVWLHGGFAAADEDARKEACAGAYDGSQVLRDEGRLALARAQLLVCEAACPARLAEDCRRWRAEVEARLPSVILAARDGTGRRLHDVTAGVDGGAQRPLSADPVLLGPGEHRFRFERGGEVVERRVTLEAADRRLAVDVVFAAPGPPRDAPSGRSIAAVSLAALGGVAVVVAGVLAAVGHAERASLFDCRPTCAPEDVDAVAVKWTAAGVSAGLGGALLGTAAVLWLTDAGATGQVGIGVTAAGIGARF